MTAIEVNARLNAYGFELNHGSYVNAVIATVLDNTNLLPENISFIKHNWFIINYKDEIKLTYYTSPFREYRYVLMSSKNKHYFDIESFEEAEQIGRFISMILELSDAKN